MVNNMNSKILPFKNGDRIVFLGDSITASGQAMMYIFNYYRNHFPESDIRFYNCGVAGGNAKTLLQYCPDDCFLMKPTHVVLMLAINDARYGLLESPESDERNAQLNQAFENFKIYFEKLASAIINYGAKLIVCTPPPYDEFTPTSVPPLIGGNALIVKYKNFIENFAEEKNLPLCNQFNALEANLKFGNCYCEDHIHPNAHGQYILAGNFLASQGFENDSETDLPESLKELAEIINTVRYIFDAEQLIIVNNYQLPTSEKCAYLTDYVNNRQYRDDFFKLIAETYLKEIQNLKKLQSTIEHKTAEIVGGKPIL